MSSDLSVRAATPGAARVADALLRSLGGRSVLLRLPQSAVAGDDQEQLGMAAALFQDIPLAPVAYRRVRAAASEKTSARYELMVSASAVQALMGSMAYSSASALFAQAVGVVVDQVLMEIEAATASEAFGQAYLYRLDLRAPLQQRV
ncbi:MAG: hypothetical protein ACYCSN_18715 [Acidobacteriaceae bacterium]